jgi:NTP pyrophosphatase (non-canonical NTP hydrolase)
MYKNFKEDIVKMNTMFKLPVQSAITIDQDLDIKVFKFHTILTEEVDELLDIADSITYDNAPREPLATLDHYVQLADLLGDVIIYCMSEALKHGIPIDDVLKAIMESQWSKLGETGEVIKDVNGKFLKGPNYKPPEEAIKRILEIYIAQSNIRE